MKKILFFGLVLMFFTYACGGSDETNDNTQEQNEEKTQVEQTISDVMTIEKSCKLDNERAELLMKKYWPEFKDKEYKDIKDLYAKYKEEDKQIYAKYGIVGKSGAMSTNKYVYWCSDHRSDLKKYRKAHPELDFYTNYPEYTDAITQLYHFDEAQFKEKQ